MSYIIDRRQNAGKKSTVNRQRFLRRYKKHIKRAVEEAIHDRSIKDIDQGGEVTIPRRDISEPVFHHGDGGLRRRIFPGNREFVEGDEFKRPEAGGGGSGQGKASNQGEGEDDFTFTISQEEFLDFMFEDLELPWMVRKQLKDATTFETRRAGFTNTGSPEKLNIVRSLRAAHARRIALTDKGLRQEIRTLRKALWALEEAPHSVEKTERISELKAQIAALEKGSRKRPFLDEFDLRYTNLVRVPLPSSKAVMFCIMDVSGSMTQSVKNIAKRFFILLYLFLNRNYKQIEVVFVRHHTHAKEVDEQEFFYSRETGGTIVSSALALSADIIDERYPPADWNIYIAQASDGDNWDGDSATCSQLLTSRILPKTQYYAYVEITTGPHQNLWHEYEQVQAQYKEQFAMQQITDAGEIYPVFRRLFEKRNEGAVHDT